MWNSLPHSLRAGTLACTDATPGTVSALLRCYLLATHFGGFLSVNSHPLVVLVLNLIFPWNWLASWWAEHSRRQIQQSSEPILQAVYHFECVGSLALASTRKGYHFAEMSIDDVLVFEDLYHPCQNPSTFTPNSFHFPSDKTLVLITGSNMSGKSTFLRTLGVAQLLSLAGSAVPCTQFKTGLFVPLTCLRVSDSLRDGASYFYAEVQRLKWVLDQLKDGALSLVLIDEIFRGTNNRERLLGSHAYVKALLSQHARSFVTTHDLELTAIEKEEPGLSNMHFSDKVSQGQMLFDYKIRPGASPTTNALKIMSMVGLPVEIPT
jgi:DNA mismatch repair ATPase MutS